MRGSDEISIDGAPFVSAARAAKEFGFVRDYVARLCREGAVRGQQIESNWYVDLKSLQDFLDKREERQKRRNEELRRAWRAEPEQPDSSVDQKQFSVSRLHAQTLPPPEL